MEFLPKILVVDDEQVLLDSVGRILKKGNYPFDTTDSGKGCIEKIEAGQYDVVLLDLALPDIPGEQLLPRILAESGGTKVVIITGHATVDNAIRTLKMGAADFIAKPFAPDELRNVLARLSREIQLSRENELLRRRVSTMGDEQMIVGESKVMREALDMVERVAPTDSTVLVLGESGTGKELIARAIHEKSHRSGEAFVPIDCTSLVETLLESELFGHVKGSFTGAVETKHGYFELAGGGSMFFDEVGNLPMSIQAKLLRVLQSRQFSPVGSTKPINADVRILAATNQDLERQIKHGEFREDLFYRLNVVPIHLPPLRMRKEDIPLLVDYFMKRYNRRRPKPVEEITPEAMGVLQTYPWPGNVRELENAIERALILEDSNVLTLKSLPIQFTSRQGNVIDGRPLALDKIEKEHIAYVLKLVKGNRSKAARLLSIDRKTLYNKISKYGL